jgi:hypothetical protein
LLPETRKFGTSASPSDSMCSSLPLNLPREESVPAMPS